LHASQLGGRSLIVNEARPKTPRGSGFDGAVQSSTFGTALVRRVGEGQSREPVRKPVPARKPAPARPPERCGVVTHGRISKLFVGQAYGFIRVTKNREVFFHRSDVHERTSFNEFVVGDAVTFELLEDAVSGARALRVERRQRRR
jgi:cold shock CspA family protein